MAVFFDPFRSRVEPNGFVSKQELIDSRNWTLECFRRSIADSDYFVFTLGLTERWVNKKFGYEYPMCPGTSAGDFNTEVHSFTNLEFGEVIKALVSSMEKMREVNPNLRFLLTVSPVPLTATYEKRHVL
jgi:hypothetical protein